MWLSNLVAGFIALTVTLPAAHASVGPQEANLIIQIHSNALLADPSTLPASTSATLQRAGIVLRQPLSRNSTFDFHHIEHGSYLLTMHCREYSFAPLRVDVEGFVTDPDDPKGGSTRIEVSQTFWGHEWSNKGESRGSGLDALVVGLTADKAKEYYLERAGFSPLQFLKSPMILMAVFTLGMTFGLPYLMNSMDEETRAEFEQLQSKSAIGQASNPATNFQNFDFAAWMSGQGGSGSNAQGQKRPDEGKRK